MFLIADSYDENDRLYGFVLDKTATYFYVRDTLENVLGIVDTTDVLMNCIGAEIGLFFPLIFKGERSDRFANVASAVCSVAAIPALTYAIATTILTFPMYKGLLW